MIYIHTETTSVPGPVLTMDCPACNAKRTAIDTAEVTSREKLFGLIPATTNQWTTITCRSCKRTFRSPVSTHFLADMTCSQISNLVATEGMAHVDGMVKIFICASMIIPGFGVLFGVIGVIGTRHTRSGWRIAAYVGLVLSISFLAWMLLN